MPIACGHSEDGYHYVVQMVDGTVVPVLKTDVPPGPTWPQLAAAAGADFYRIEDATGLSVGAASADVAEPGVVLPPAPLVTPLVEPAGTPVVNPFATESAPVADAAPVEAQP